MLAAHLSPTYVHHLVALSTRGPDPQAIVRARLPCSALATGRRLQMTLAWQLRRIVRDTRADVVHAWSHRAARIARVALFGTRGVRLVEASTARWPPAIDALRLRGEVGTGLSRQGLLSDLDLPPRARIMGVAGRLTREKQVVELLWALDQIRCVRDDVYLLVIGDGDARSFFERYARLYEIVDHVRFLGWRNAATAVIAQLDVYCTASLQSSCSLAVLEAMALGVPVVAADTPAHRLVVVPRETGLLADARQRSEIARSCLQALEDDKLAVQMSAAAQRRVAEAFTVEQFLSLGKALYGD
jgi:glycosyltransferase involved in cell wall biosynthesis